MKKVAQLALLLTLFGFLPVLSACVETVPPGAVFVPAPPPVAVVEVVGTPPGPDVIWIRGFHRWNGSAYIWTPGRWEARPRARAVWVDGRWVRHSKGWYWREGHWK